MFENSKPFTGSINRQNYPYTDAKQIQLVEKRVKQDILVTWSGIDLYWEGLGFNARDDFFSFIRGKRGLDLGSGYGGLAIETMLHGVQTEIYGINPNKRFMEGGDQYRRAKESILDENHLSPSDEDIMRAMKSAYERTYDFYAHKIDFPDNSFDFGFDLRGPFFHLKNDTPDVFVATMLECIRVLKHGGSFLFRNAQIANERGKEYWKLKKIRDLGLNFEFLFQDYDSVCGIRLNKI